MHEKISNLCGGPEGRSDFLLLSPMTRKAINHQPWGGDTGELKQISSRPKKKKQVRFLFFFPSKFFKLETLLVTLKTILLPPHLLPSVPGTPSEERGGLSCSPLYPLRQTLCSSHSRCSTNVSYLNKQNELAPSLHWTSFWDFVLCPNPDYPLNWPRSLSHSCPHLTLRFCITFRI